MTILINIYRKYLVYAFPVGTCRFSPTCSEYMLQAVGRHGIIRGTYLGVKRILRCNGFFKGGFDPVPS